MFKIPLQKISPQKDLKTSTFNKNHKAMPLHQTYLSYKKELYPHYYLCHYLPRSAGRDTLSHSLLKFKRSRQPDLEGWIDCALEMTTSMPVPPGATLIRALHHNETAIPDTPVAPYHAPHDALPACPPALRWTPVAGA